MSLFTIHSHTTTEFHDVHLYDRQADQEASGDDQAEHHELWEQRDGGEEEVYPSKWPKQEN